MGTPAMTLSHRLARILLPVGKRIAWGALTLWLVSMVTFALLFLVPLIGRDSSKVKPEDVMAMTIAGAHHDEHTIANIKRERGLDRPKIAIYFMFVHDILTNQLKSYRNQDRILSSIARRFPNTLILAVAAVLLYLALSIPIGLMTARLSGTWLDRFALLISVVAISIPTFWLGRLFQYYLGYQLDIFGIGGSASLRNLPLPALTLAVGGTAYYSRLLHSNLRAVLTQDHIRAARARGLSEGAVLGKHALKNAMIPLVTVLGLDFAGLLSGLIFTEKVFGWPGIGSLAVDSVLNQDTPMIMGTVLFSALMVVVVNIAVDFVYRIIDPRIRVE